MKKRWVCYLSQIEYVMGKVDKEKKLWVGNREDVTDMAISAVFDWFSNQMDGKDEFSICYPDVSGMKLKMVREE